MVVGVGLVDDAWWVTADVAGFGLVAVGCVVVVEADLDVEVDVEVEVEAEAEEEVEGEVEAGELLLFPLHVDVGRGQL